MRDAEACSLRNAAERAVSGFHKGAKRRCLASRRAFWFSLAIALPGVEVHPEAR